MIRIFFISPGKLWKQLARYLHTTRHLKCKQIFFRLYYVCKRMKKSFLPSVGEVCANNLTLINSSGTFSRWREKGCLLDSGSFSFHGETGQLDDVGIWNSPHHSKLWIYNLHYFDDLTCVSADLRRDLLNRYIATWLDHNPPYKGNGWEPYPLSLRIVNWVKWFSTQKATPRWLASLAIQADALMQQIEYHILGNHVFANGKAMIFVGTYFTGKRAEAWLKKGLQIIDHEVAEQFLSDGGHFELSPMYHATMLWDMCDLVRLADQSNNTRLLARRASWLAVIERGLDWLSCMVHPDGDIAFFNDAAFSIAPTLADIAHYAWQLGVSSNQKNNDTFSMHLLKESGYCIVNLPHQGKAILDVAKIGPNYQPGHAHADTLSFELSLYGQRFMVNSGTSQYGEDEDRQHQRSTKAHNTVCIDDQNSSDVWAGFRVAQRAYPRDLLVYTDPTKISIDCAHNGYARLPNRNTHRREWSFSKNSVMIRDLITGAYSDAKARFYFHPDVFICQQEGLSVICSMPSKQTVLVKFDGACDIKIEPSHWYPYFGARVQNTCLIVTFKKNELETHIAW